MLNSQMYTEILKEYERLQDDAKARLGKRKEEIYLKIPRVREIEQELNLLSIKIAKAILTIDKNEIDTFLKKLKDDNAMLTKQKDELLLQNGFEKDYLKEVYACEKCKDTGYTNNKKCECFNQKIIDKVYDMYILKENLKKENFDRFDFNFFSKEIDSQSLMSPYENIRLIFKSVQNFIKDFDEKFENLIFYGPTGVGKTFLCNCIAKELLDKGKNVIYTTAANLFNIIENKKFNKSTKEISESLEFIVDAELLIIDDLGTEFITILSSSELFNIINSRILQKKSTIISTNLEPDSLMSQYSSRVVSRFYGYYEMVKVFGQDIRMNESFKKTV